MCHLYGHLCGLNTERHKAYSTVQSSAPEVAHMHITSNTNINHQQWNLYCSLQLLTASHNSFSQRQTLFASYACTHATKEPKTETSEGKRKAEAQKERHTQTRTYNVPTGLPKLTHGVGHGGGMVGEHLGKAHGSVHHASWGRQNPRPLLARFLVVPKYTLVGGWVDGWLE